MTADAPGPQDATPITRARNRAVLDALPFGDRQDFADARRGFIGTLPEVEITNAQGRVVWSLKDYAFLAAEDAPPTVNPSLWRQARLNMENGLFHVTEGIYQIRGFDISNMTLIEGERGVIVIDPLISTEVARAGLERSTRASARSPRGAPSPSSRPPSPSESRSKCIASTAWRSCSTSHRRPRRRPRCTCSIPGSGR